MKEHNDIQSIEFVSGEVYLFNDTDPDCPRNGSLWTLVFESDNDSLCIESYSSDLRTFTLWKPLPATYRYCRLTTRSELREFISSYAYFEAGRKRD